MANSGLYDLDGINTERFYFNPKSAEFVKETYKYPEFDLKDFPALREQLLMYIILLYDKHSPLREDKDIPFIQKKRQVAEMVGLMKDGRIIEEVVDVLLGANDQFNRAFAKYLTFQHSLILTRIAILEIAQERAVLNTMKNGDAKSIALSMQATKDLEDALNEASGGNDWFKMKEAIQFEAGKLTEGLRVEDFVDREELDSPYPNNYKPKKLKYASHRKPDDME